MGIFHDGKGRKGSRCWPSLGNHVRRPALDGGNSQDGKALTGKQHPFSCHWRLAAIRGAGRCKSDADGSKRSRFFLNSETQL